MDGETKMRFDNFDKVNQDLKNLRLLKQYEDMKKQLIEMQEKSDQRFHRTQKICIYGLYVLLGITFFICVSSMFLAVIGVIR
jgi:hypothetical protein